MQMLGGGVKRGSSRRLPVVLAAAADVVVEVGVAVTVAVALVGRSRRCHRGL